MPSEARARRALDRQLAYQRKKAHLLGADTRLIESELAAYAQGVRSRIDSYRPFGPRPRVLEVGSGAHGLVFFLGIDGAIGVDPLAREYGDLFRWQSNAKTIAAFGEALPFDDGAFDVVLSDNVVDHAGSPAEIVRELARVLAQPGGVLYFTVNVHHVIYGVASRLYGVLRALGMPFEIGPFADHTVHLTLREARNLFRGLGLVVAHEDTGIDGALAEARTVRPRHVADRMKRLFFKNARFELILLRPKKAT